MHAGQGVVKSMPCLVPHSKCSVVSAHSTQGADIEETKPAAGGSLPLELTLAAATRMEFNMLQRIMGKRCLLMLARSLGVTSIWLHISIGSRTASLQRKDLLVQLLHGIVPTFFVASTTTASRPILLHSEGVSFHHMVWTTLLHSRQSCNILQRNKTLQFDGRKMS